MDKLKTFLECNNKIWKKIMSERTSLTSQTDSNKNLLLVEMQTHPILLHANAVFSCIINNALGYKIGFLDIKNYEHQNILKSYNPNIIFFNSKHISLYSWLVVFVQFILLSIKIIFTKKICKIIYIFFIFIFIEN